MQYTALVDSYNYVATSAFTVLGIQAAEKSGGQLIELGVTFHGTTANEPVRVELVKYSMATAGVATEVTLSQVRGAGSNGGSGIVPTIKAFRSYTEEPTVATVLKTWRVSPTSGMVYQAPLGREVELPPQGELAKAPMLGIRIKGSAGVILTAYMEFAHGPS